MGVLGLMPLLTRFAPRSITLPAAQDLRGMALAVDSNIFVHRFLKGTDGGSDEKRHLRGMQRLVTYARKLDVLPLFVFDGKVPAQGKELELEKRQAERLRVLQELDGERARAQRIGSLAAISAQLDSEYAASATDEARTVAWLESRTEALPAADAQPAPTISGRLDRLEAAACRELLAMLGRLPDSGGAEGPALPMLQALSAERLAVLARRTEPLTGSKIEECLELVTALGCTAHVADAGDESEAVCSQLCNAGVVDAVCSEDLDVVAHGARLLRGFGGLSSRSPMALVDGRRAHEELGLSRAAFVDMCILCGTDFSSTLKKVGPITALRLIREHGSIERVLERCAFRARPGFAPAAARAVFLADPRPPPPIASRRELELLARAPDPAAVAALLGDSHPPPAGSDPFSARTVPL